MNAACARSPGPWTRRVYKTRPTLLVLILCLTATPALAQRGRGEAPTPRAAAPIDLTGYWVSLVTDDWRWRMVTPPKGDILYLPVNDEGRRVADAWDPAKDETAGEACRAFGAGGIMHLPGRLHITWDGDTALKAETDTGQQTRIFAFGPARPSSEAAAVALPAQGIRRGQARRFASRPRTCVRATIAGTACPTAPTRT